MNLLDKKRYFKPFVGLVMAVGGGILVFCVYRLQAPQIDIRFLLLFLLMVVLGARLVVHIPSIKGEITVNDSFVFLTMLMCGGEAAVLVAAAAAFCSSLRVTKKVGVHFFNAAMMTCSTFLTIELLRAFYGPIRALATHSLSASFVSAICLMAMVQYVGNSGLATIYTGCKMNRPFWTTWRKSYLWTSVTYFAGASAAFLIAKLITLVGFYGALATTPIIAIVYVTYKTYLKNIEISIAQAEQAQRHANMLQESEERFRSAFDYAAIGMALVSQEGRWLQVNRSLCQIVGYSEKELLAMDIQAITHPEDLGDLLLQQSRLMESQVAGYQTEKRYIHKLGHQVWTLLSVSRVRDPETHLLRFVFQIQDITDRKRAEARLVHDAFHDGLTGLPNRALFIDHLRLAVARSIRQEYALFSVLFLDLDRFKVVNDSLGHLVGDQLLMAIASRLKSCLRPGDTIARLGGDEFTILLEDLKSNQEAIHIAERIQRDLAQPFELEGRLVFASASIGIAPSTIGYEQPEDILRDADTAMYYAKSLGGTRHQVFDKSMHTRAVKLLQMQNDLRGAIEREELTVEYQPIVSLDTFKITGFEALARWKHAEHGQISPNQFIPVAEETGLIIPIGEWILRQACTQTRRWQELYPSENPLTISVNLSAKQFAQPDLIERIERVLLETGLEPPSLRLEITESVVVENVEAATGLLKRLRKLGVGLSIDDFGTGYSSLSSLHSFPISTLKIDGSFVSRMDGQNENTEIVRTIMSLAANLGMDVVAEGVETLEQVTKLRTFGCEKGQGFFFSRPIPADKAESLLNETAPMIAKPQSFNNVESLMDRLVA
ncbi:MAG TPA: EAL domain-containing protein [Pyrinomonadaceae bacterium]|nr:EAL domain-containing protein [Pyrinomonadaceae bacterium]